jgi:hypothetical protein
MRFDGKQYLALPPVDRTSYVVGALDMLSSMILYAHPNTKPNMQSAEAYANKHSNNSLRVMFDEFMAANPTLVSNAAASSFVAFLDRGAKSQSSNS